MIAAEWGDKYEDHEDRNDDDGEADTTPSKTIAMTNIWLSHKR